MEWKKCSDIRVWNANTIESITNDKKIKQNVEKEIENEGYIHLYPEELFTKKLCLLYGDDKVREHSDLISRPYLLPFNPIVLTFMTPSQVRNNFQIMDNGDSYSVSLKLTLHNHLGQKVEYDIRKEYGTDDIEDRKSLPVSSLFGQTLCIHHGNSILYFIQQTQILVLHQEQYFLFKV